MNDEKDDPVGQPMNDPKAPTSEAPGKGVNDKESDGQKVTDEHTGAEPDPQN